MKARRTCGGVNPLRPVAGFFKPRCRSRRTASIISFWSSRKSEIDRKSTRLNSSHGYISYAVFCLKKKQHEHDVVHVLRLGRQPTLLDLLPDVGELVVAVVLLQRLTTHAQRLQQHVVALDHVDLDT